MGSISLLFAAYAAVLLAEIAGDKLLYTSGVLATRYRFAPILSGMAIAFAGKMAFAVAVGSAIARLPIWAVSTVTALSFGTVTYALWRRPAEVGAARGTRVGGVRGALLTFTTLFLSEWGDIGQITAAAFAARFGHPLVVWAASVGAMVTKGALAVTIGAACRTWLLRRIAPRALRYATTLAMMGIGIAAVTEELWPSL